MKKCFFPFVMLVTAAICCVQVTAAKPAVKPRVFVNPGHGGLDSNDRPCPFYCYGMGDTVPYFESVSNLHKGHALTDILQRKGYETATSRVTNNTEDDLDLFEIMSLAANSGADLFFAIHSNATGIQRSMNAPLALYRGFTGQPTVEGNDVIAQLMMDALGGNGATQWSSKPEISGDWTFYDWGYKVGLGVLRYNKLPGMLCEGSFHDYIAERCRLENPDYCWLEAWNQSCAMDKYFNHTPKIQLGCIAGLLRGSETSPYKADGYQLYDSDNQRGKNAFEVELFDAEKKLVATYTTDNYDNGFYLFKNLKLGLYYLYYGGQYHEVTVKANEVSYLGFTDFVDVDDFDGPPLRKKKPTKPE